MYNEVVITGLNLKLNSMFVFASLFIGISHVMTYILNFLSDLSGQLKTTIKPMKNIYLTIALYCCIDAAFSQTNILDNYIGNTVTPVVIGGSAQQVDEPRILILSHIRTSSGFAMKAIQMVEAW